MQTIRLMDVMDYLAGKIADPQRRREIEEARRQDRRVARWFERCQGSEPAVATPPAAAAPAAAPEPTAEPAPAENSTDEEALETEPRRLTALLTELRDSLWVQLPGKGFPELPLEQPEPWETTVALPLHDGPRVTIHADRVDGLPTLTLHFDSLPDGLNPRALVLARPARLERNPTLCLADAVLARRGGLAAPGAAVAPREPVAAALLDVIPHMTLPQTKRARQHPFSTFLKTIASELAGSAPLAHLATASTPTGTAVELFQYRDRVGVLFRVPRQSAPLRHAFVRLCWQSGRAGAVREESAVFPCTHRDRDYFYGQHVLMIAPEVLHKCTWTLHVGTAKAAEVPWFQAAAVRELGSDGLAVVPLLPGPDGFTATLDSEQQRQLFADPRTCRLIRFGMSRAAAGKPKKPKSATATEAAAPITHSNTPAVGYFFPGDPPAAEPARYQPGQQPLPGTKLRLVQLLGSGCGGEVWSARDGEAPVGNLVALKFLRSAVAAAPERRALLERIAQQSQHPGIVPLRRAYLDTRPLCLQYDYVEGQNLRDWLRYRPRPEAAEVANLVRQMAEALGTVHGRKFVHRDLKPSNILVPSGRNAGAVKVLDFGLAALRPPAPARSPALGTRAYASPEQLQGSPPDPRDDVYALGVLLFQLLTGDLTTTPAAAPQANRRLPKSLAWIVSACCAGARHRLPDGFALAAELERCQPRLWVGTDRYLGEGAELMAPRDTGNDPTDAAARLQALAEHPEPRLLQRQLFGPRCVLLDSAYGGKSRLAMLAPLLQRLLTRAALDCLPDRHNRLLLQARLRLLLLLADEPADPRPGLEAVFRLYESVWRVTPTPRHAGAAPAALAQLPAVWRQAFEQTAAVHGWQHPGVLAAFDQVLGVHDASARPAERSVTAWVLFAWPGHNDGCLCRLTLERVAGGVGGFYPHQLSNGYTAVGDAFQRGLGHAWQAAVGAAQLDFDVRWSLTLLPMQHVDGRFAEATCACALRALLEGAELDPHVMLTAQLRDADGRAGRLAEIGVPLKLLAGDLRPRQVNEILVARGQLLDTEEVRDQLHDGGHQRIQVVRLATLAEAYDRLVRRNTDRDSAAGARAPASGK